MTTGRRGCGGTTKTLTTSAVVRTAIPARRTSSRNGRWKRLAICIVWFVIQTRGAGQPTSGSSATRPAPASCSPWSSTPTTGPARRARHERILAEVAQEEAEAAEAEIAETASTLDIPLHLRIDRELDAQLRQRAAAEHIPTSALVRRLLRQTVREHESGGLTVAAVEDIARRVTREELRTR